MAATAYHLHFYTSEYQSLLDWYLSAFHLSIRSRGSISTTTNVPGMNLSFADSSTTRFATSGSAIDSIGFIGIFNVLLVVLGRVLVLLVFICFYWFLLVFIGFQYVCV